MHPAFSVIFLTTLIGVGQGLFLALFTGQSYSAVELLPSQDSTHFYGIGGFLALLFLIGGLIASVFHLGHPERAWRAAAMWRTSWLSREVIALPTLMALVFVYAVMHYFQWDTVLFTSITGARLQASLVVGVLGVIATFILFLCTGMIYACIKFLQEWASSLTVINYLLLGTASGFFFATAFAAWAAPELMRFYGIWTAIITLAALVTRTAALMRNRRIKHKSSIQSAIGVRHTTIVQKAQGAMGDSYNTREYVHGAPAWMFRAIKWVFLVLVFPVPLAILWLGLAENSGSILLTGFLIQYIGLLFERWFFFAQANHPQNIYYGVI
ncbi:MAG TPA: DMSO reductase [Gammaproteobacteria bacterium]|nr:DMSO reductase [Gammaproteobacteria bacterium]